MNMHTASTHKYSRFGRGSVILQARAGQPLDLETIAQRCPSVLATDKHSSRSERYTYVSTYDVMKALAGEGFQPFSIMQGGSKDEEKRGFTKHLIRFRSEQALARRDAQFEVVMLGSHDGTTSTQLFGGFFRSLCQNGTIWFDGEATKVAIPHKGDIVPQVIDAAYTVVGQSQIAYDRADSLRGVELNRDERIAFARAALVARFGDDDADKPPVQAEALLVPRRVEDQSNDLWTTFQRVQENVIRGGIGYQATRQVQGRVRTINTSTRPVRSVDGDVKLNRALWTLTAEMAKLKNAA